MFGKIKFFSICIILGCIFLTFHNPENAYKWNHSEEVELVVEDEKTALVVGKTDDGTPTFGMVLKSDKGWKIGNFLYDKTIFRRYWNEVYIAVDQYKNTEDYYISLWESEKPLEITDTYHSRFYCVRNVEKNG